jgi:hypothetical protein
MFNTGLLSGSHRATHIEKTVIHLKNIQKTIPLPILSTRTNVFSVSGFLLPHAKIGASLFKNGGSPYPARLHQHPCW